MSFRMGSWTSENVGRDVVGAGHGGDRFVQNRHLGSSRRVDGQRRRTREL